MLNFFKKKPINEEANSSKSFEIELTAVVLAYEIARSDGSILESELNVLMKEIRVISNRV
jgi:hypothetical protein